jgi:hypothetical protein
VTKKSFFLNFISEFITSPKDCSNQRKKPKNFQRRHDFWNDHHIYMSVLCFFEPTLSIERPQITTTPTLSPTQILTPTSTAIFSPRELQKESGTFMNYTVPRAPLPMEVYT